MLEQEYQRALLEEEEQQKAKAQIATEHTDAEEVARPDVMAALLAFEWSIADKCGAYRERDILFDEFTADDSNDSGDAPRCHAGVPTTPGHRAPPSRQ